MLGRPEGLVYLVVKKEFRMTFCEPPDHFSGVIVCP